MGQNSDKIDPDIASDFAGAQPASSTSTAVDPDIARDFSTGSSGSTPSPSFWDTYRKVTETMDAQHPLMGAAAGAGRSIATGTAGAIARLGGRLVDLTPWVGADWTGQPRAADTLPAKITGLIPEVGPVGQQVEGFINQAGNALDTPTRTALEKLGVPKTITSRIPYEGPLQQTVREAGTEAATDLGMIYGLKRAMTSPEVEPIEQGHPLTPAAEAESERMATHAQALEDYGVKLPPRETTPQQQFVNDMPRQDLDLPKGAPVTNGLLDAADKLRVSPAYDAAKQVGKYELSPTYESSIGKVDLNKIEPEWRPPTSGDMTGARAVELSKQLRDVARELYSDAESAPTYAERQSARASANAHYQAAKAVEGGFRDAVTGTGQEAIADNWDAARTYKAKLETWRGTLDGNGNVVAPKAKKLLGDDPISEPMERAASVANQFPELFRSTRIGMPSPGLLRRGAAYVAPIAGAGIGGSLGGPLGAIAGEEAGRNVASRILGR